MPPKRIALSKHVPVFDIVFYAFIIIGIDISGKENKVSPALKFGMKFMFYVTSIIGLLTGAFHFGFFLDGFDIDIFSAIVHCYSGLLLNYILRRKKQDFAETLQVLSKCNLERKRIYALNRKRMKYIIILSLCMLYFLTLFTISICFSITTDNLEGFSLEYPYWTSALQNISSKFSNIHSVLLYFTSFFCCYLPLTMDLIAYDVIFYYLSEIMREVKSRIALSPHDFKLNHKMYINRKLLVEFVDKKFMYVHCYVVLVVSTMIYYNIFSKLQNIFHFKGHRIIDIMLVVFIGILAIKCILEGGEIPVVNEQILKIISESPFEDKFLSHRIAFILEIQQGLCLTIGGMIAITKAWTLILMGTILTYSLLIKSL